MAFQINSMKNTHNIPPSVSFEELEAFVKGELTPIRNKEITSHLLLSPEDTTVVKGLRLFYSQNELPNLDKILARKKPLDYTLFSQVSVAQRTLIQLDPIPKIFQRLYLGLCNLFPSYRMSLPTGYLGISVCTIVCILLGIHIYCDFIERPISQSHSFSIDVKQLDTIQRVFYTDRRGISPLKKDLEKPNSVLPPKTQGLATFPIVQLNNPQESPQASEKSGTANNTLSQVQLIAQKIQYPTQAIASKKTTEQVKSSPHQMDYLPIHPIVVPTIEFQQVKMDSPKFIDLLGTQTPLRIHLLSSFESLLSLEDDFTKQIKNITKGPMTAAQKWSYLNKEIIGYRQLTYELEKISSLLEQPHTIQSKDIPPLEFDPGLTHKLMQNTFEMFYVAETKKISQRIPLKKVPTQKIRQVYIEFKILDQSKHYELTLTDFQKNPHPEFLKEDIQIDQHRAKKHKLIRIPPGRYVVWVSYNQEYDFPCYDFQII